MGSDLHGGSQLPIMPVPENTMPSCSLGRRPYVHMLPHPPSKPENNCANGCDSHLYFLVLVSHLNQATTV